MPISVTVGGVALEEGAAALCTATVGEALVLQKSMQQKADEIAATMETARTSAIPCARNARREALTPQRCAKRSSATGLVGPARPT